MLNLGRIKTFPLTQNFVHTPYLALGTYKAHGAGWDCEGGVVLILAWAMSEQSQMSWFELLGKRSRY